MPIVRGDCAFPWWYLPRWFYRYFKPSEARRDAFLPRLAWEGRAKTEREERGEVASCEDGRPGDVDTGVHEILFFGDFMPTAGLPTHVDEEIRQLFSRADVVIGNMETPLIDQEDETFMGALKSLILHFYPLPNFLHWLDALGVGDAKSKLYLSLANNHVFDLGDDGFARTIKSLEEQGINVIGNTLEPQVARILPSVGLVGWTHWLNMEGRGSDAVVTKHAAMQAVDWQRVKREQGIKTLIGYPHWGIEFNYFPERETQSHAREFVDKGFDILAGGHSHTVQPVVRLTKKQSIPASTGEQSQQLTTASRSEHGVPTTTERQRAPTEPLFSDDDSDSDVEDGAVLRQQAPAHAYPQRVGKAAALLDEAALVAFSLGDFNGFSFPPALQYDYVRIGQLLSVKLSKKDQSLVEYTTHWIEWDATEQRLLMRKEGPPAVFSEEAR